MVWKSSQEKREWHCAASREDCYRILEALKDQGLDVELVGWEKTGDAILRVVCIYDGPDADPTVERWKSYYDKD